MMIDTNMGRMPVEDYKEIRAMQYGFDNYADMKKFGYDIDIPVPDEDIKIRE